MKKSMTVGSTLFCVPFLLCGPVWATSGTIDCLAMNVIRR